MSSDRETPSDPVYGDEAHAQYAPNPQYGRTGWDALYLGRRVLLAISGLAAAAVVLWFVGSRYGFAPLVNVARAYWPAAFAPLAGWYLGRWTVKALYRPDGRVLIQLDVAHHLFRAVFVPEATFRLLRQTGNNVVYHAPSGVPVYLVSGLDLADGFVDYGWTHELDPLTVMTRENAYVRWNDTLRQVLEDNLELMVHPTVIGLGFARDTLRRHLDALAAELGLGGTDLTGHSAVASDGRRPMGFPSTPRRPRPHPPGIFDAPPVPPAEPAPEARP